MARKVLWLFGSCYLVVLGVLALALHNASSQPRSQEVLGIGIGPYYEAEEVVYLSGRYLNCARSLDQAWAVSCTIEIVGQPLEILARRNPGGQCAAFYAGKQWPCRIVWTSAPAPWFAYLDDPLGLDKSQLDILRWQYFRENLPDITFYNGVMIFSIINTIITLIFAGLWLRPRVRSKLLGVAMIAMCAGVTWGASLLAVALLTNGFWD